MSGRTTCTIAILGVTCGLLCSLDLVPSAMEMI